MNGYPTGREVYLNLADEASADDFDRAFFDEPMVKLADEYAAEHGLPKFDAVADLDVALDLVGEHRDDGQCHEACWRAAVRESEIAMHRSVPLTYYADNFPNDDPLAEMDEEDEQ
jgi:hypothetical protein